MHLFVLAVFSTLWGLASAAPPLTVPGEDSALLKMMQIGNHTRLSNNALLNPTNDKTLNVSQKDFPDPYDQVVNSMLTIEFYGYRGTVALTDLWSCAGKAANEVYQKVKIARSDESMDEKPYVYSTSNVELYLIAGEGLTWKKWGSAPFAIAAFVQRNGLRGTQFILLWNGIGPVGYGQLISERQSSVTATSLTARKAFQDPYDRRVEGL